MDLFDILSMDERIIVYSSVEDRSLVTWNQSVTLQCWRQCDSNNWEEVDIRTSDKPLDYHKARQMAIDWIAGNG